MSKFPHHAAQDRPPGEDEQTWELSRFTPMLQEVIEDLVSNTLSSDEYPHVRPPHAASNGDSPCFLEKVTAACSILPILALPFSYYLTLQRVCERSSNSGSKYCWPAKRRYTNICNLSPYPCLKKSTDQLLSSCLKKARLRIG